LRGKNKSQETPSLHLLVQEIGLSDSRKYYELTLRWCRSFYCLSHYVGRILWSWFNDKGTSGRLAGLSPWLLDSPTTAFCPDSPWTYFYRLAQFIRLFRLTVCSRCLLAFMHTCLRTWS